MEKTVADVFLEAALRAVGKRELMKSFEKLFPKEKVREKTPVQNPCEARVKGERTGIKVGRYVLFDAQQCSRETREGRVCAVHGNQIRKFGTLPLGYYPDPLTEEQKKVFGEL